MYRFLAIRLHMIPYMRKKKRKNKAPAGDDAVGGGVKDEEGAGKVPERRSPAGVVPVVRVSSHGHTVFLGAPACNESALGKNTVRNKQNPMSPKHAHLRESVGSVMSDASPMRGGSGSPEHAPVSVGCCCWAEKRGVAEGGGGGWAGKERGWLDGAADFCAGSAEEVTIDCRGQDVLVSEEFKVELFDGLGLPPGLEGLEEHKIAEEAVAFVCLHSGFLLGTGRDDDGDVEVAASSPREDGVEVDEGGMVKVTLTQDKIDIAAKDVGKHEQFPVGFRLELLLEEVKMVEVEVEELAAPPNETACNRPSRSRFSLPRRDRTSRDGTSKSGRFSSLFGSGEGSGNVAPISARRPPADHSHSALPEGAGGLLGAFIFGRGIRERRESEGKSLAASPLGCATPRMSELELDFFSPTAAHGAAAKRLHGDDGSLVCSPAFRCADDPLVRHLLGVARAPVSPTLGLGRSTILAPVAGGAQRGGMGDAEGAGSGATSGLKRALSWARTPRDRRATHGEYLQTHASMAGGSFWAIGAPKTVVLSPMALMANDRKLQMLQGGGGHGVVLMSSPISGSIGLDKHAQSAGGRREQHVHVLYDEDVIQGAISLLTQSNSAAILHRRVPPGQRLLHAASPQSALLIVTKGRLAFVADSSVPQTDGCRGAGVSGPGKMSGPQREMMAVGALECAGEIGFLLNRQTQSGSGSREMGDLVAVEQSTMVSITGLSALLEDFSPEEATILFHFLSLEVCWRYQRLLVWVTMNMASLTPARALAGEARAAYRIYRADIALHESHLASVRCRINGRRGTAYLLSSVLVLLTDASLSESLFSSQAHLQRVVLWQVDNVQGAGVTRRTGERHELATQELIRFEVRGRGTRYGAPAASQDRACLLRKGLSADADETVRTIVLAPLSSRWHACTHLHTSKLLHIHTHAYIDTHAMLFEDWKGTNTHAHITCLYNPWNFSDLIYVDTHNKGLYCHCCAFLYDCTILHTLIPNQRR